MMVANSSNLIITVKPINQHNNVSTARRGAGGSNHSSLDRRELQHVVAPREPILLEEEDVDEDDVQEHLDNISDTVMIATAPSSNTVDVVSQTNSPLVVNNEGSTRKSSHTTQVVDDSGEELVMDETLA